METHWLSEIYNIDGVEGVLVCSNTAKIIDKMSKVLDDDKLENIAIHLLRIISANNLKNQKISDMEIYWEKFHIIVKNSSQFLLVSFCTSSGAQSLLRITQNVVLAHLLEDKKFMKMVKKHTSEKSVVLRKDKLDESEIKLISKLQ
ncbi:MAG: hypothetical protein KAS18_01270 [Calditrichia bacterium]|nr:hypothetical protein [Calditrichia bacterium]